MKPNYWKIRVVQNKTNISEPLVKSPFSLSRIPTPHSKTPLQVRTKHLFGVQSFISLENLLVQDQTYPITDLHCLKSTGTSENDFQLPRPVNTGEIEITPKGADPGNDFSNRSRSRSRSRSNKGQWLEDQEPKDYTAQSRSIETQSKALDLWDEDEDESCSEYNFDDEKNESFQETHTYAEQHDVLFLM